MTVCLRVALALHDGCCVGQVLDFQVCVMVLQQVGCPFSVQVEILLNLVCCLPGWWIMDLVLTPSDPVGRNLDCRSLREPHKYGSFSLIYIKKSNSVQINPATKK